MNETFSGKFVLRVGEELHRKLSREAAEKNISLNTLCLSKIEGEATHQDFGLHIRDVLANLPKGCIGLVAFGSRVKGYARADSDLDLLVVLDSSLDLKPQLYKEWDKTFGKKCPNVSPHFVRLPIIGEEMGSLWLEVALSGLLLFDRDLTVQKTLVSMREMIAEGKVIRKISHGQPYWVWRNEKAG